MASPSALAGCSLVISRPVSVSHTRTYPLDPAAYVKRPSPRKPTASMGSRQEIMRRFQVLTFHQMIVRSLPVDTSAF